MALAWFAFVWATGRKTVKTALHPAELTVAAVNPGGSTPVQVRERPRNIILVIADGLGFAHLAAGRAALYGIDAEAIWDELPVTGWHRGHPSNGLLTDSATAATALATGHRTRYGFVAKDADNRPLATLFERASERGYRTGIVTDSYIWDATPAAFVAHVDNRDLAGEILSQLAGAPLDILFGELEDVGEGIVPTWAESEAILAESYTVIGPEPLTADDLLAIDRGARVAAIFEEDQVTDLDSTPNLLDLQRAGLARISETGEPFVLLIESEELDSAGHRWDLARTIRGLEVVAAVLEKVLEFAADDGDTLVLFTGDHETGGLAISTIKGNRTLKAIWASADHTAAPVPLLAFGPGADELAGAHTTWQVGRILMALLRSPDVETGSDPAAPSEP